MAITRDGEEVAALLPIDEAVWCAALADRFCERRPPFTQPALDARLDEVLAGVDVAELMGEQRSADGRGGYVAAPQTARSKARAIPQN